MRSLVAIGAVIVAFAAVPRAAEAQGTGYWVTIAARVCDQYTDIAANKSRNNIMESLKDLGPNTPYTGVFASTNVNPTLESKPPQNKCRPLSNWKFRLGTGIAANKVTGTWGSLSVVSSPYTSIDITTQDEIDERDDSGVQTDDKIQGATEVELTADQLLKAQVGNLWIQGGTETDPVLDKTYPGGYGFAALRCATDNVNGDNVEYIKLPTKRVYCYAYYVQPPPTSGTIVIAKRVSSPAGADKSFTFGGNISFEANHQFALTVENGSQPSKAFYRAAGSVWTANEIVPTGWRLTGIDCPPSTKGSAVTKSATGVSIALIAGDTVTCTFVDELVPPPGKLALEKVTTGGIGTFPLTIDDDHGTEVVSKSATTTVPGVAAPAMSSPFTLTAGKYFVDETLPAAGPDGSWRQVGVNCNAVQRSPRLGRRTAGFPVTIDSGKGAVCVFENAFVPSGSIAITKTTEGGVGTTGFVITALDEPGRQYLQNATTTEQHVAVIARGDSMVRLPLGRYAIQETRTVSDVPNQEWELLSVTCGRQVRAFEQGEVTITLTESNRHQTCSFVNVGFTQEPGPTPTPTPPPTPTPAPEPTATPTPGPTPEPQPDLVVTKRSLQRTVTVGSLATYEITVRNAGAAPANEVVVADAPRSGGQVVSARASRGTCGETTPIACRVGRLDPGRQVTLRVRMRATAALRVVNLAAAGSASDESSLRNNIARTTTRVRDAGDVLGVCSRAGPKAHMSC